MTFTKDKKVDVGALVNRFVEIGTAQHEALLDLNTRKFNRLFDQKIQIVEELSLYPGDQRHALLSLFQHPNMQVRLNAAKATLAIAPVEARGMLEDIASSGHYPQAMDAGMTLDAINDGTFKPT